SIRTRKTLAQALTDIFRLRDACSLGGSSQSAVQFIIKAKRNSHKTTCNTACITNHRPAQPSGQGNSLTALLNLRPVHQFDLAAEDPLETGPLAGFDPFAAAGSEVVLLLAEAENLVVLRSEEHTSE